MRSRSSPRNSRLPPSINQPRASAGAPPDRASSLLLYSSIRQQFLDRASLPARAARALLLVERAFFLPQSTSPVHQREAPPDRASSPLLLYSSIRQPFLDRAACLPPSTRPAQQELITPKEPPHPPSPNQSAFPRSGISPRKSAPSLPQSLIQSAPRSIGAISPRKSLRSPSLNQSAPCSGSSPRKSLIISQ